MYRLVLERRARRTAAAGATTITTVTRSDRPDRAANARLEGGNPVARTPPPGAETDRVSCLAWGYGGYYGPEPSWRSRNTSAAAPIAASMPAPKQTPRAMPGPPQLNDQPEGAPKGIPRAVRGYRGSWSSHRGRPPIATSTNEGSFTRARRPDPGRRKVSRVARRGTARCGGIDRFDFRCARTASYGPTGSARSTSFTWEPSFADISKTRSVPVPDVLEA